MITLFIISYAKTSLLSATFIGAVKVFFFLNQNDYMFFLRRPICSS